MLFFWSFGSFVSIKNNIIPRKRGLRFDDLIRMVLKKGAQGVQRRGKSILIKDKFIECVIKNVMRVKTLTQIEKSLIYC